MRQAIVVILDGLRRDALSAESSPYLMSFAARAQTFDNYRSVFPSATRVVSASLATGCFPARHGLTGNSLALMEDGRLVVHDAGHPDFLQHKRRITGQSLAVPTLAQRLADAGGARIYSNVSPGAAYAHDPDGHGHVFHRAGSFGPGRMKINGAEELNVTGGLDGDDAMTDLFVQDVLGARGPALGVLWLGHPDATQHEVPLGSPENLAALRRADRNASKVIAAVDLARVRGDDILLFVGSDHGHQTIIATVDVEDELIQAGLKDGPGTTDVVAVANGTSSLIYVHMDCRDRIGAMDRFLRDQEWAGEVYAEAEFPLIGHAPGHGLAFAVSLRSDDEPNEFGVKGRSLAAMPPRGKSDRLGCGQHGGIGRFEQIPFLMIDGPGFQPGQVCSKPASIVDIAPSILKHLGHPAAGMDGAPLHHRTDCIPTEPH